MEGMTPADQLLMQTKQQPLFKQKEEYETQEAHAYAALQNMFGEQIQQPLEAQMQMPVTLQSDKEKTLIAQKRAEGLGVSMATKIMEEKPIPARVNAKKTDKQKKDDAKRLSKLKKQYSGADALTLEIYESVKKNQEQNLLMLQMYEKDKAENPPEEEVPTDSAILLAFAHKCRLTKKGKPVSSIDKVMVQQNMQFMKDYASGNAEKRKTHLDRMLDEILGMQLNQEMMMTDYIQSHAAPLKEMADKLTYFENVMKDERNAQYFEHLEPWQKDLLKIKMDPTLVSSFCTAVGTAVKMKGVNVISGMAKVYTNEHMELEDMNLLAYQVQEQRSKTMKLFPRLFQQKLILLSRHANKEIRDTVVKREFANQNDKLDETGLEMLLEMHERSAQVKASLTPEWVARLKKEKRDNRIFQSYLSGYMTKENTSEALNEFALEKKQADEKLLGQYISKDMNERAYAVETLLNDALGQELTPEMLEPAYIASHYEALRRMTQKFLMVFNILRENKGYVEKLGKEKTAYVNAMTFELFSDMDKVLQNVELQHGINYEKLAIHTQGSLDSMLAISEKTIEQTKQSLLAKIEKRNAVPAAQRVLGHLDRTGDTEC